MDSVLATILQNPHFNDEGKKLITRAYNTAVINHKNQKRISGEDLISHPATVATFLSEHNLDAKTIAAALLHDSIEDTPLTLKTIEEKLGGEVAFLVEGVTKLSKIDYSDDIKKASHIDSLKKMLFAMAQDIRVILIKLADRLHNMQTLSYLPTEKRKRIAQETLEIYAPIAGRLGMGQLKGDLEDLAFPYVYPQEYAWLMKVAKNKFANRAQYVENIKPIIKRRLLEANIPVIDIHSRVKHQLSLYKKMVKEDLDINNILDLVAMRIIVPDIKSCYEVLGVIHKYYKPLAGLIKDFIAVPKPNGYRSLHTTVFCEKGKIVEIQIRTPEMHEFAESGIAAHWAYSEGGKENATFANQKETYWVAELRNFLKSAESGEDISGLKMDFFKNRIFVFTPKGEVKDLPEGATPIDFAYAIHTDLGNSIKGAKIGGKIVPLEYELKNEDVVEILKSKIKKPSLDWLRFVKTNQAQSKIRAWFRKNKPIHNANQ